MKTFLTIWREGRIILREGVRNDTKNIAKYKALGADNVVNKVLEYGVCKIRNKLLRVMNMILTKGKYLLPLENLNSAPLQKIWKVSVVVTVINWIFLGSKLLSMMILIRINKNSISIEIENK